MMLEVNFMKFAIFFVGMIERIKEREFFSFKGKGKNRSQNK
jgi:hypothetical protein